MTNTNVFEKILLVGTAAAFDALETKDANKLYFLYDTKQIYKGSELYTDGIRKVTTRPTTPAKNVLYDINGETIEYHDGTNWVVVRPKFSTGISASSAGELVTAKQVYDFIMEALEDVSTSENTIKNVAASTTADATLEVTNGAGTKSDVVVPGVVTTPSYDSTTRTITLPVSGKESLVIALGKDIFIDKNADNGYDVNTGNIVLFLNDGTGEEGSTGTKIEIPASGLVDVYTGKASTSATVSVGDDNKIEVAVKVSAKAGNALTIEAGEGEEGLYISLDNYYTKTEIDDKLDAINTDAETLSQQVNTNKTDIATLKGDATTEGSVAKAVADAKEEIKNTTDDLATRVENLENAFGFGTF